MWSNWESIENAQIKERGFYGIYQIRIVSYSDKPISINRLVGIDKEGIIYIGRAIPKNTLAKRINCFIHTQQLKNDSHSGADTYVLIKMNLKCSGHIHKDNKLQYRVLRFNTGKVTVKLNTQSNLKDRIKKEGINALAEYFNKHCELPPCNSNFPGKWDKFTHRLEQLWQGKY